MIISAKYLINGYSELLPCLLTFFFFFQDTFSSLNLIWDSIQEFLASMNIRNLRKLFTYEGTKQVKLPNIRIASFIFLLTSQRGNKNICENTKE